MHTCNPAFEDLVVKTLASEDVLAFPPFPPVVLDDMRKVLIKESDSMYRWKSE